MGTCLESIESFGLLHDGEHEAQTAGRGMRTSYTGGAGWLFVRLCAASNQASLIDVNQGRGDKVPSLGGAGNQTGRQAGRQAHPAGRFRLGSRGWD